ncbi:MAG: hypothetical protein O2818_07585 [Bacteroidetes bacterium]|nr:hypothetical protein [Bacteroidota bacterium]MDA1336731.1 hypothetical protein [Bacteroidota bacterium]
MNMNVCSMQKGLFLFLAFGITSIAQGQNLAHYLSIHKSIRTAQLDTARLGLSNQFASLLEEAFTENGCTRESLKPLEGHLGIATAGEGEEFFAIITWNVELTNKMQAYDGIVVWNESQHVQRVIRLHAEPSDEASKAISNSERYSAENWPGAVYYNAVLTYKGKKPIYTLLGWDGADDIRNRKVIEPLTIQNDEVKFGAPVILSGMGTTKRIILEYAEEVSVLLKWRPDMEMIVMDHLSPPQQFLQGQTSFYGPDMTYDALTWDKNKWVLLENIEVRDLDQTKPWIKPTPVQ